MTQKLVEFDLDAWRETHGKITILQLSNKLGISRSSVLRYSKWKKAPVLFLFALKGIDAMCIQKLENPNVSE